MGTHQRKAAPKAKAPAAALPPPEASPAKCTTRFEAMLASTCGATNEQVKLLANHEIVNAAAFAYMDRPSIRSLCNETRKNAAKSPGNSAALLSSIFQRKLEAFGSFAQVRRDRGIDVDPSKFDQDALARYMVVLDSMDDTTEAVTVSKPKPYVSGSPFSSFRPKLLNYLMSIKGRHGIPLSYLIREDPEEGPAPTEDSCMFEDDALEFERLALFVPLKGAVFKMDNRDLYMLLKELFGDSCFDCHVQAFEKTFNGCKAFFSVLSHAEGNAAMTLSKNDAYSLLTSCRFSGDKKGFPIEKFVQNLLSAHQTLEKHDEAVPETKKVHDLLQALDTSNPLLLATKTAILSDAVKLNNFAEASSFLNVMVANGRIDSKHASARRIAGVRQNDKYGKRIPRKNQPAKSSSKAGSPKASRHYNKEEWHNLPQAKKDEVQALRERNKARRNIAAISAATRESEPGVEESKEEPASDGAGNQMSSRGKSKKA